jgi:hypothetical protein
MPSQYAPCLNYSNLQAAEELVYPDFRIRHPRYLQREHLWLIRQFLRTRFKSDRHWYYYLNQHGR